MARLDDKVLVVTGGTQGIGESVAIHAAETGAAGIVICGRQQDKGQAVEAAIQDRDCPAVYVPADLSQPDDCRRLLFVARRLRFDDRFQVLTLEVIALVGLGPAELPLKHGFFSHRQYLSIS